MCSDPQVKDGNTFACRRCNACLATRRADWVSRGMAEKTIWPHSYTVTLTYSDDTQRGRDGARMFCYADVQGFMARLRDAAAQAVKGTEIPRPTIRFVCAGEQGDRNGRCHWHIILYSDYDLVRLGTFVGFKNGKRKPLYKREEYMSTRAIKRRLHWSMWQADLQPLGFVTVEETGLEAMKYVLSYCLKDQFTEEKSRGTMREAKSENFSTGLFRMSKRPALGEEFLLRKLNGLAQTGSVLPNLKIKVPGMKHYWVPSGTLRKKLLEELRLLNLHAREMRGCDAPQWSSLVASLKDDEKALEVLNGPQEDDDTPEDFARAILLRGKEAERDQATRDHARRCGSLLPCEACLHHHSDKDPSILTTLGLERYYEEEGYASGWTFRSLPGFASIGDRRKISGGGVNPYCLKRGSKISRQTFPKSDPNPAR